MKTRIFKNWVTSIIGALMMLAGIAMYIANRIPDVNVDFTFIEMASLMLLGWVFLAAKDSLLEGLFGKIFKVSVKE